MTDEANGPMKTRCAIAGGGPAGIMLGYLLARRGIDVMVLEKYKDFFRDFRGDTVHPSTLDALETLGLLDDFLKLTKNRQRSLGVQIAGELIPGPDFRFITAHNKFIVLVPQWDFLNFMAERGKAYPGFHLLMETEATDVIRENGRITGLRAKNAGGEFDIAADLVVGCDGRHSTVRERAGMKTDDLGAPIDVLWFRIDKEATDPVQSFGSIDAGRVMVLLDRDSYWQVAYVIPKGAFPAIQQRGLEAFGASIVEGAAFLAGRAGKLTWDDVKLLSVTVDRLYAWAKPGLLCIGDAAHAMSPVGGVGINMAVQDAIATANILAPAFLGGTPSFDQLEAVQKRREFPVRVTQGAQVAAHKRLLAPQLTNTSNAKLRNAMWYVKPIVGVMRFIVAQMVGVGVRPERPEL